MPKDLDRGKRIVINNAIKDFVPDTKYNVNKLFGSWKEKIRRKTKGNIRSRYS